MKAAALVLATLVLIPAAAAACTSAPQPAPTAQAEGAPRSTAAEPGAPREAAARDSGFELVVRAERAVYRAGGAIRVEAQLAPVGRGRSVEVSGSSSLVTFGLEQLDGDRRMEPISTADCARRELSARAPLVAPFAKSGAPSSDPEHEAFWTEFFADPELRLPAGRWRIHARATFHLAPDCSGRAIAMDVPLDLLVEP